MKPLLLFSWSLRLFWVALVMQNLTFIEHVTVYAKWSVLQYLFQSSHLSPILQMRILRHRAVNPHAQVHTGSKELDSRLLIRELLCWGCAEPTGTHPFPTPALNPPAGQEASWSAVA